MYIVQPCVLNLFCGLMGNVVARINLSIDSELYMPLQKDAVRHNCIFNVYLITFLERLYKQTPFYYQAALAKLENEAENQPAGRDFALAELPSFAEICVAKAEDAPHAIESQRTPEEHVTLIRIKNEPESLLPEHYDEDGERMISLL